MAQDGHEMQTGQPKKVKSPVFTLDHFYHERDGIFSLTGIGGTSSGNGFTFAAHDDSAKIPICRLTEFLTPSIPHGTASDQRVHLTVQKV